MLKNNWKTYSEDMLRILQVTNYINLVYGGDKMLKLKAKNFKKKAHVKKQNKCNFLC